MIKTTVVIPNYNGIGYLKDCLATLELNRDDNYDFDTIVVDNGSEDGSAAFIKENYPKVRVIELGENTGFAAAVNVGIRESVTDYVLLLNNDIKVDDIFVEGLEKRLDSDKKLFSVNAVMMSMADNDILDGAGDYYCALGWAYAFKKGKKTDSLFKGGDRYIFSACGGASIYRKSVFDEIGLFDEAHFAYLEDIDVGYRAKINGYKSILEKTALCEHAGSGFSGSRYNEFKIKLSSRNSIYLIYKNMPLLQIIINLPFLLLGFGIKILFFALKGFGRVYVKGLAEGFKMCRTDDARSKKVRFRFRNLGNYINIQGELWFNIIRRLWS